jgi:preprotein translocase subunit YajC
MKNTKNEQEFMGKVFDVKEDHVVVEIDENVRIRVIKSTVRRDSTDLQQK